MRDFIKRQNPLLLLALVLTLAFHGGLSFYTYGRTYDAFVHIFFGDHYARVWFDHWDYRWYTGFPMTSYPPGSQQTIALLSFVVGLRNGFVFAQTFALLMCVLGIYRFSKVWVSEEAAGYAALLFVFASSITETVHVFGQLPTTFSLGFLLNALPFVYRFLDEGKWKVLLMAWSMNAATTAGHHVTTLFGAVFFVAPVMVLAIVEKFRLPLPDEPAHHPSKVTRQNLKPLIVRRVRRVLPVLMRSGVYGVGMIMALVLVVLPYWLWSRSDPITQVSIPHSSRDSFIQNTSAGLVFWLIPYGLSLVTLPYVFYKGLSTKAWPMALSLAMLVFLGTGGTTPFPRMLLGGAFDILTLDRFTFWATITQLPLMGEFIKSLRHGRLARYILDQFGQFTWRSLQVGLLLSYVLISLFTANLTQFRKFQPAPIDVQPIVNFMEKDQHWRWRYLTLGFGDQVAWLGSQMTATSVDGNYHSARRLPELTTTPVERLEGAKYRGIPGIGSLQQFLAVPDKYNLKYVFSNDQFYDPLLYFSGWHRLQRLENGIMVWERADIAPLPEILPRKEIPVYQRMMWGIVPMSALVLGVIVLSSQVWGETALRLLNFLGIPKLSFRVKAIFARRTPGMVFALGMPMRWLAERWVWLDTRLLGWSQLPDTDESRLVRWQVWLDWIQGLPRPRPATPSAKQVRTTILLSALVIGLAAFAIRIRSQARDPIKIVEAYYDDLDFRRFRDAYARMDPDSRPDYDQWQLELSVQNGLVASYGKLDAIRVSIVTQEPDHMVVEAETLFITSLAEYTTRQRHTLVKKDDKWYVLPDASDVTIAPNAFFRKGEVAFYSAGRRRVTLSTTSFADIIDRPQLQILSAQFVKVNDRYSVVGELLNSDVDPADITVNARLFDADNNELVWYNAQSAVMHKLFPREVTPFRVDFEGVAGAVLSDTVTAGDFDPAAFSPIELRNPVDSFQVYGKAVVTTLDLFREVATQDIEVVKNEAGEYVITGRLLNNGVQEATIPHILVTYYDEENHVLWVDDHFVRDGIRPQKSQPFSIPITTRDRLEIIVGEGDLFANIITNEVSLDESWRERLPAPPETGYASFRLSVHYFVGIVQ